MTVGDIWTFNRSRGISGQANLWRETGETTWTFTAAECRPDTTTYTVREAYEGLRESRYASGPWQVVGPVSRRRTLTFVRTDRLSLGEYTLTPISDEQRPILGAYASAAPDTARTGVSEGRGGWRGQWLVRSRGVVSLRFADWPSLGSPLEYDDLTRID